MALSQIHILIGYFVVGVYTVGLMAITIYCLMQFHLLIQYKRKKPDSPDNGTPLDQYPMVTVQLPIFNEKFVVERLIDNIVQLEYPASKIEIHVLDDSTDDTVHLAKAKIEHYQQKGINIKHVVRENRQGFKAGALKEAMNMASGEFICIFDADFLPKPNFLEETLPHFMKDPKVGVVQTRWQHINQKYSILTELQAFQLNLHFTVEQKGRDLSSYLLQFNGTAGVWRRTCIEEAGGWEADTLTEDLDLSYRAQMKGWKINFLEHVLAPSELPAEINSLKSQQFRWMKGGAETAKKLLPSVWKSSLPFSKKLHASSHLLSSSVFLFIFLIGIFSVPLTYFISSLSIGGLWMNIFMISLFTVSINYYVANVGVAWPKEAKWKMILKFLFIFPVFLALSMGLSLHNSIAVLQGYLGKKSPFVRTPKLDITQINQKIKTSSYLQTKISIVTIFEGILVLYFMVGISLGIYLENYHMMVFQCLLMLGYASIFYLTIKHSSLATS